MGELEHTDGSERIRSYISPMAIETCFPPFRRGSYGNLNVMDFAVRLDSELKGDCGLQESRSFEADELAASPFRESLGRFERREFDLSNSIEQPSVALLVNANLDCLQGVDRSTIELFQIPPSIAFAKLFEASAHHGAYCIQGRFAPEARRDAWNGIAGILAKGRLDEFSIPKLNDTAMDCSWYWFRARSRWFRSSQSAYAETFDLGLVCLTPDRRRVIIAAHTNSD